MNGESIGKFITDNHEFLGSCVVFTTLVLKMARDFVVGRKKDKEREIQQQEAQVERQQILQTVNANTTLTAHVANEMAKSQGKSLDEIISGADENLDSLLARYRVPFNEDQNVNESRRVG